MSIFKRIFSRNKKQQIIDFQEKPKEGRDEENDILIRPSPFEASMKAAQEEWVKKETTKRERPNIEKLKEEKDITGLINCLDDDDEDVQFEAALALGKIGDTRVVEPLIQALNAKSSTVRWRVALSLGEIKDTRAIEPLKVAATDQDSQVQWRAAEALGIFGEFQYLERLLGEGSERDRIDIADSMVRVGGLEVIPSLVQALQDKNKYKPASWAIMVPLIRLRDEGRIDEKRSHELLAPAIQYFISIIENATILKGARSYDEYVSLPLIIGALGDIGDPSAISPLDRLLAKIKDKVAREGIVREYINTGIAAGYISTQDNISHIEGAINNIRKITNA